MTGEPTASGLIDTRDVDFYVLAPGDGTAHMGGKTRDWQWVAKLLRTLADEAEKKGLTRD